MCEKLNKKKEKKEKKKSSKAWSVLPFNEDFFSLSLSLLILLPRHRVYVWKHQMSTQTTLCVKLQKLNKTERQTRSEAKTKRKEKTRLMKSERDSNVHRERKKKCSSVFKLVSIHMLERICFGILWFCIFLSFFFPLFRAWPFMFIPINWSFSEQQMRLSEFFAHHERTYTHAQRLCAPLLNWHIYFSHKEKSALNVFSRFGFAVWNEFCHFFPIFFFFQILVVVAQSAHWHKVCIAIGQSTCGLVKQISIQLKWFVLIWGTQRAIRFRWEMRNNQTKNEMRRLIKKKKEKWERKPARCIISMLCIHFILHYCYSMFQQQQQQQKN